MLLNFENYINILFRRKYFILFSLLSVCVIPMILVYVFCEPVYKTSGQLKIVFTNSQSYYLETAPKNIALFDYSDKTKVDNTFFEMVRNPRSLQQLIKNLSLTDKNGNYLKPDDILIGNEFFLYLKSEGIGVDLANGGEIIEVFGYSKTIERSEELTNLAIEYFLELYAGIFKDQALTAQKALEKRLKEIDQEIYDAENEKSNFLLGNKFFDFSREKDYIFDQYFIVKQSVTDNNRTLLETKSRFNKVYSILKQTPAFDLNEEVIKRNSLINEYKQQLVSLAMTLEKQRVEYLPNHPDIISTQKQIEILEKALNDELLKTFSTETKTKNTIHIELYKNYNYLQIEIKALDTRIKENILLLTSYEETLKGIQKSLIIEQQINRKLEQLKLFYSAASQGLEETKIVLAMEPVNAAVLNLADASMVDSEKPFFPNHNKILFVLLFLAASQAFALIILAEATDPTIFDINYFPRAKDSKYIRGLPKSGIFFRMRNLKKSYADKEKSYGLLSKNSNNCQALNSIISGIGSYSSHGVLPRVVLFSGADSGVGTSTLSYAIAAHLANKRKKVLAVHISIIAAKGMTIDSKDIQNPEMDTPLDQQIKNTRTKGLDLLILNQASLTANENFISELKNLSYDYMIIDTDPVAFDYTAVSLCQWVDSLVVVAKFRKTPIKMIENTIEIFNTSKEQSKIVLINQVTS